MRAAARKWRATSLRAETDSFARRRDRPGRHGRACGSWPRSLDRNPDVRLVIGIDLDRDILTRTCGRVQVLREIA